MASSTNTNQRRRGRPSKAYTTTGGVEIQGLYRIPGDGRWKNTITGERWTEPDEAKAVAKFLDWKRAHDPTIPVTTIRATVASVVGDEKPGTMSEIVERHLEKLEGIFGVTDQTRLEVEGEDSDEADVSRALLELHVPDAILWPWLRKLLTDHPDVVAAKTGIPEIASLKYMDLARENLRLATIWDAYVKHNGAKATTKAATKLVWERFLKMCPAVTVEELTTEMLKEYRARIEANVPSAGTRKLYYSKIKTVLAFGLKVGLDNVQIRRALDRAKVLWTPGRTTAPKPAPISRKDFHTLLKTTKTAPWGVWHPWLLVGLNFAMHIGEVCEIKWAEIDLKKGTYASIRGKTEAHRIPRAAVLWPETIKAIKAIPRKGEYLFTSQHGTKYNRNKRVNSFAEFRNAAKLPHITFDCLRDGAYTAAVRGTEEKWARLLAGHRSPGLQDSYVLRDPAIVKPACDAVHRAYFDKAAS